MIKQILQFIQNHWILCSGSAAILGLILFEELKSNMTGAFAISVQDTTILLNRENAIVVDLRNQTAFSNGHILGAINIACADIDQHLNKLESHKNHTVILVSDQDSDTQTAKTKLQKAGFTNIRTLAGGLNSWKDAQLPLSKN